METEKQLQVESGRISSNVSGIITVALLGTSSILLFVTFNISPSPCLYTKYLLFPLLLLSIGALFSSIVAIVKHGFWWTIASLASLYVLSSVFGAFEGC